MTAQVSRPAPDFTAEAVYAGEFQPVKLSDFRGKYVILFFYPHDFSSVCPTELVSLSDDAAEFWKRGAEIVGVSVDSKYSHLAWVRTPADQGGLGHINFPLVSDLNKAIARNYGVLLEDAGVALRAMFLIDRSGIIRHATVNDLSIGRNLTEVLRVLDALQHYEREGEACPANWAVGEVGMAEDPLFSRKIYEEREILRQLRLEINASTE